MSCRVALLGLHRAGIIQPPCGPHYNGHRVKRRTPLGETQPLIVSALKEFCLWSFTGSPPNEFRFSGTN